MTRSILPAALLFGMLQPAALAIEPDASLPPFDEEITAAAFDSATAFMAAGGEGGVIHIRQFPPGSDTFKLDTGVEAVSRITFSPDGAFLLTGTSTGAVQLWNLTDREIASQWKAGEEPVTSLAIDPKGQIIACGDAVGTVRIWDISEQRERFVTKAHDEIVRGLAFSPDGTRLASASWDRTVKIWDTATGTQVANLTGHDSDVNTVAFNHDGSLLASGEDDGEVILWDLGTNKILRRFTGHQDFVLSVAFSPDGSRLVTASVDATVRLWNVEDGTTLLEHKPSSNRPLVLASFSGDGSQLAAADNRGSGMRWDTDALVKAGELTANADPIYQSLFASARFLERRRGMIPEDTPVETLELILAKATAGAETHAGELENFLTEFVGTEYQDDFKAEDDANLRAANVARDQLSRNLLVAKAVADFAATRGEDGADIASTALHAWCATSTTMLEFYPGLANDPNPQHRDAKLTPWYERLHFIARRNTLTAAELLRALPDDAVFSQLKAGDTPPPHHAIARLHALEARYDEILRLCRNLASTAPAAADAMATMAVEAFAVPADHAGRSERGRDATRSLRPEDFAALTTSLADIVGIESYRQAIPKSFAAFCTHHRPVTRHDIEVVLAPLGERTPQEMRAFVAGMIELFQQVQTPKVGEDGTETKASDQDFAATASTEFAALYAVVESWSAPRPTWQADLMGADVRFAWAKHQLMFVESRDEPVANQRIGDLRISKTDATGFRELFAAWEASIASAAQRLLDSPDTQDLPEGCESILARWFDGMVWAGTQDAYRPPAGGDLYAPIRDWLARVPDAIRTPLLDHFATTQLKKLDPPPTADGPAIRHERKFDFVEAVASLAPDTSAGRIFASIRDDYRALGEGIRFHVVPEGRAYESGEWAAGAGPAYPVDAGGFALWFTLVHTEAAQRTSGGFRRYTRDDSSPVNADDFATLSETERKKYADGFLRYLTHQLTESFEIIGVHPVTKTGVLRTFPHDDGQWRETPLYYVVLRPIGNVPATELPALRLDLDFPHDLGRVVLPFHSPRIALRPGSGTATHVRDAQVRQELDDSRRNQGELKLTVISESLGLPPEPRGHAAHLPAAGFAIDPTRTESTIDVISFPGGKAAARVRRTNTYHLGWQGGGASTDFTFPTYPDADPAEWMVENHLTRPGQIAERHIAKGVVSLSGLPWRWDGVLGRLGRTLGWAAAALLAALAAWAGWKYSKRGPAQEIRRFPLAKPAVDSPLATANLLRRIASSTDIPLEIDETEALLAEIETLENLAMLDNDSESARHAAAIADRWLHTARQRFATT